MSLHKPRDRGIGRPALMPSQDDVQVQSAVLSLLLAEYPVQFTVSELAHELIEDPNDFAERDAIKRVVRDLSGVGLLHRQGNFVLPSRAARYFERLESDPGDDCVLAGGQQWLGE